MTDPEKRQQCEVEIPGVGRCELSIENHPVDALGRKIHRAGPVTWNGGMK